MLLVKPHDPVAITVGAERIGLLAGRLAALAAGAELLGTAEKRARPCTGMCIRELTKPKGGDDVDESSSFPRIAGGGASLAGCWWLRRVLAAG